MSTLASGTQAPNRPPANPLVTDPILPTLLRLALPNVIAMAMAVAVGVAETKYVGLLGTAQLAAMALVFPLVMLVGMMSAGAMGGGVSSAVSRALGARDPVRARTLALHALVIAVATGIIITRAASDGQLGGEVSRQVFGNPKALLVVGLALLGLLMIPGLPAMPSAVRPIARA
jgi:hypothetical protein